jgi:alpha-D-xyloside xylohydrolase
MGARDDRPDYDWAHGVTLRCFELPDGYDRVTVVPGHDGTPDTTYRVRRQGGRIIATSDDARGPWAVQAAEAVARTDGAGELVVHLDTPTDESGQEG